MLNTQAFDSWAELLRAIEASRVDRYGWFESLYRYQAPLDREPQKLLKVKAFKNRKVRIWSYDGSGVTLEPCAEQLRRFRSVSRADIKAGV